MTVLQRLYHGRYTLYRILIFRRGLTMQNETKLTDEQIVSKHKKEPDPFIEKLRKWDTMYLLIFLIVSLLTVGLFYEWASCIASVILIVYLMIFCIKEHLITLKINIVSLSLAILVFFYLISAIWAVDPGMSLIGFFKFLPVLLFAVCLMQSSCAPKLVKTLPYIAAATVLISLALMYIPFTSSYFSVAGRLSGVFQYPNTFALFVLVAELIEVRLFKLRWTDIAVIVILVVGLLYTGSRTGFVLAVISNALMLFHRARSKKKFIIGFSIFVILCFAAIMWIPYNGETPMTRFLSINWSESTFVGRLLYYQDSLPVILKHPFGLGYCGYYYSQYSFQTGLYTVKFIHNDFLQIFLDVGWIPGIAFIAACIRSLVRARVPGKIILITIFLFSCLDFNLQFPAVFFILIMFMDLQSGKTVEIGRAHV